MLKKLILALMIVCCAVMAEQGKKFAVNYGIAGVFHVVGDNVADTTGGIIKMRGGDSTRVQIFPSAGYVVERAYAVYGTNDTLELSLEDSVKSKYLFVMPQSDVTLKADFKKKKSAITVLGCDGKNLICKTVPDSAVFGDSVKIVVEQKAKGTLSVTSEGDKVEINLAEDGEKRTVTFAMGKMNQKVTFDLKLAPTRFDLSLGGNCGADCSLPDSANVGDTVKLAIKIPEGWGFNVQATGLEQKDFLKNEDGTYSDGYSFIMPDNDVEFKVDLRKTEPVAKSSSSEGSSSSEKVSSSSSEETMGVSSSENPGSSSSSENPGSSSEGTKVSSSSENPGNSSSSENSESSSSEGKGSTVDKIDTVYVNDSTPYYSIDVVEDKYGEIKLSGAFIKGKSATYEGKKISVIAYPKAGYGLESISVKTADGKEVTLEQEGNTYSFTMPASDVNVKATYKEAEYKITVNGCGKLKCTAPESAKMGEEITITIAMLSGYKVKMGMEGVDDFEQSNVDKDFFVTFTMPGNDVTFTLDVVGDGKDAETSDDKDVESSDSKDIASSDSKDDSSSSSSDSKKSDKDEKKSGKDKDAIANVALLPQFNAVVNGRLVQVMHATVGKAYSVFDMNGHVLKAGRVESENFNVDVNRAGNFVLRIGDQVRTLNVK